MEKTMKTIQTFTCLALVSLLAGCGGGSTGNNNDDTPAFGSASAKIELLAQRPSLLANRSNYPLDTTSPYASRVDVRVTGDNGVPAPLTVIASLQSNNSASLRVDGGARSCTQIGPNGLAPFILSSGELAGSVTLSASVDLPFTPGTIENGVCTTQFPQNYRTVGQNFTYVVEAGPAPFEPIRITASTTNLPLNPGAAPTSISSPYVTAIQVSVFGPDGRILTDLGPVQAASTKPDTLLLSGRTPDINGRLTGAPTLNVDSADILAGTATFYAQSLNKNGTVPIRVVAVSRGVTFAKELVITVGSGSSQGAIAGLEVTSSATAVYVRGTSGNTTSSISARILDDAGNQFQQAPTTNNILFEVVNPADETLVGRNIGGSNVEGTAIRIASTSGLASVNLRSGTRQGLVVIKATADRADNNVDNGIQSPIIASRPVAISDGKLYNLTITSPVQAALSNQEVAYDRGNETGTGPINFQRGQYRVPVSVVATDRQGNPVLPGTVIEFGMIDAPVAGYPDLGPGQFLITGGDGDPREGGTNFTAPTGRFRTAGGGAGAGDTLIVFGEEDPTNRDLESARQVARVNSETSLDIAAVTRFNLNDDAAAGVAVDRGPVLPYVVGRATIGNITNGNATTNENGIATTTMNYPVSRIGHAAVVWARSIGDTPPGQTTPELVTDAEVVLLPAAGPLADIKFNATPETVPAGVRTLIQACLQDKFDNPITGVVVSFGFNGATGTIEGATGSRLPRATGADGCSFAFGRFFSTGGTGGGAAAAGSILLSAGGKSDEIKIGGSAGIKLFALPETLGGSGGRVILRLLDANGNPIPGIQLGGTCTGGGGTATGGGASLIVPPGVTNDAGETTADISANLNTVGTAPGTASCVFDALGASVTVRLQGLDACTLNLSPRPTGCPALPGGTNVILTVRLVDTTGGVYVSANPQVQVIGNAGGINCVNTSPTFSGDCTGPVRQGSVITLVASAGVNGAPSPAAFCRWTGSAGCFGNVSSIQVPVDAAQTCVAVFTPNAATQPCPTR
jgi:hypothetical protein